MGWLIYFTLKAIELIIKAIKMWCKALLKCFSFGINAFSELRTLHWDNERDRSKIVKNGIIIAASIGVVIFLIWLLSYIASGGISSTGSKKNKQQITNVSQGNLVNKRYGWENAPNNANEFVFYDENEKMVKNKDYKVNGYWYYFDDKGYMIKDKWHGDYYYGADGKMVTNQWVGEYYVGADGAKLKGTVTPDGYTVGADGRYIEIIPRDTSKTETIPPTTAIPQTVAPAVTVSPQVNTNQYIQQTVAPETVKVSNEDIEELYIVNKEVITDFFDYSWTSKDDNYNVDGCEISISKPIIAGVNAEEVTIINNQISNLIQQLIERLKDEEVLSDDYNAISAIKLDKPSIKYTDNKATITLDGSTVYTTDYNKNLKSSPRFVIEYHRKNKNSKMNRASWYDGKLHIQSDEVFYAE